MAHGLNPMIKREIDCNSTSVKSQNNHHHQNLSQGAKLIITNSNIINSTTPTTINNTGNTKMGSRRIFTPQFKLQVLESYRNDSDCKGNQRATARKYGIHRRQIQKWLQCETNLRTSVANLNQNNIKHQFHNINHQLPIVVSSTSSSSSSTTSSTMSQLSQSLSSSSTYTSNNNNNSNSQNYHQQHHSQQQQLSKPINLLSLDTARHSVALTPITTSNIRQTTTGKCMNSGCTSNTLSNLTNTVTMEHTIQLPTYKINLSDNILKTHTPAIPIIQHNQQQQQQHENLLMPSASLPCSPVLNVTNQNHELRDYQPIISTGNIYMNENYKNQQIYENMQYYNINNNNNNININNDNNNPTRNSSTPIDLSLGPKRRNYDNSHNLVNYNKSINETTTIWHNIENNNNSLESKKLIKNTNLKCELHERDLGAVDLTCRKRKATNDDERLSKSSPEKIQKPNNNNDNEQQQAAKPIKLFKPYLLDDNDNNINKNDKINEKKSSYEQKDPIIWSHHPSCISPIDVGVYDSPNNNHNSTTFQSLSNDEYSFPAAGSPTFQCHTYNRSTTTIPTTTGSASASPTTATTFWCPKGSSPVSGYDTASTYSDSSEYYKPTSSSIQQHQFSHQSSPQHQQLSQQPEQIYSIDFKMEKAVDTAYYHDMTCRTDQLAIAGNLHRNDVQRWLHEQETDIRQGITLYV